jgi:hypothetical protein
MTSATSVQTPSLPPGVSIQDHIDFAVTELLASFPDTEQLSGDQRRGIIARYSSVLEGNFIYWMTGAYLAVRSEDARAIILDNLLEEVRDCHPGMLRRFAIASQGVPTDSDALAVYEDLSRVRLFIGRLSGVRIVLMMAFFEGFIQRFMAYLAKLAQLQGSAEMEYTDVHGVCDVAHTQGLFRALAAEMELDPVAPTTNLYEGVALLRTLLEAIVHPAGKKVQASAASASRVA